MDLNLKGQRVLVTGGSRGIGLAIAQAFAAEGAMPIIASRDAEQLALAVKAIHSNTGITAESVATDLSQPGATEALFKAVGEVDVLVNNAGAIPGGSLHDLDEQRWRQAWELKLFSYINLTRSYLPMMEQRGRGVICNIIGLAGVAPRYDYICGSTANAGLIAFTQGLGGGLVDLKSVLRQLLRSGTATDKDGLIGDSLDDIVLRWTAIQQCGSRSWLDPTLVDSGGMCQYPGCRANQSVCHAASHSDHNLT